MNKNLVITLAKAEARLKEATTLLDISESLGISCVKLLEITKSMAKDLNQNSLLVAKALMEIEQSLTKNVRKPLAELSELKVLEGRALTSVFEHEMQKLENEGEGEGWKKDLTSPTE